MTRPRAARLIVFALSCALCGGCSADDHRSRKPTPSVDESASSSASSAVPSDGVGESHAPSRVQAVADATPIPPSALELIDTVPLVQGSETVQVRAVDSDGAVLYSRASVTESVELARPKLVLQDSEGNESVFSATPRPERPGQITGAAFNDQFVVWMETPSVSLGAQSWVLYVYSRADGTVRVLARSRKLGESAPPAVPGYTAPVLVGDRVFWTQVGGTFRRPQTDIMGCEIVECAPQIAIPGAAYPAGAGGLVYAVANSRFAGGEVGPEMVIESVPATGGTLTSVQAIKLTPTQFPNGLAAGPGGLVWLILDSAGPDLANVMFANTDAVQVVESDSNGTFGYPVAATDYLGWAEGSGSADAANFILDKTGDLFSLGKTGSLYGLSAAGDFIVWRDKTDPGGNLDGANVETRIGRLSLS